MLGKEEVSKPEFPANKFTKQGKSRQEKYEELTMLRAKLGLKNAQDCAKLIAAVFIARATSPTPDR